MNHTIDDINTQRLRAIAGIYLCVYDLDLPGDTICRVHSGDGATTAPGERRSGVQAALFAMAEEITAPTCRERVRSFLDLSTLEQRFAAADTHMVQFLDSRGLWCMGRLIVSERTQEGRLSRMLWLVEEIDECKRSLERLMQENADLTRQNRSLSRQVDDAARTATLSDAVQSLLTHMPAMTYSKEASTGTYLVCNQMFADYAHKSAPSEVVGLRAYDIFDDATARYYERSDRIALSMGEPFTFYEDVFDAGGNSRQLQTTKLKFTDTAGRLCVLGMSTDVTELTRIRQENQQIRDESLTFSRIARALSADYDFLYYVNLTDEEYAEFKADSRVEEMAKERTGHNFFDESRSNALRVIYPSDQERFLASFTRENILRSIRDHGAFTLTYRLMLDNHPSYVYMKATQMDGDANHLIIGVNNIDAQMRTQEAAERARSERITFNRITALSGDFIVIYAVDPVTEAYSEYSASREYENLHINRTGDHFFASAHRDSESALYPEDVRLFQTLLTKENVLREIRQNGIFVMDYRLMLDGKCTYVCLKAAMVEEKDGPQLIVGIINTDAKVRREQEYARNLSVAREMANRDELTGVKNKHAYVDAEKLLNMKLEEGEMAEFAIVVCDVNDLKLVNDTLGHNAGDRYIRKACEIVCRIFKHSPVFRVGGDEFAVICQGHDYGHIDELIGQLFRENDENKLRGEIQIACGMARYAGDRNVESVFERADHQMYACKAWMKQQ